MHLQKRTPPRKSFTKTQLKTTNPRKAFDIAELQRARKAKRTSTANPPRVDVVKVKMEEHAKKVAERVRAQSKKFPTQKPITFWDRLLGK